MDFGLSDEMIGYSMIMAEDRTACPRDDIVTKLVNAKIDGDSFPRVCAVPAANAL